MGTYFTSDLHLGHANIIKYCSRPFADVTAMDEALIRGWNSRVQDQDLVYVLGDVAMGKAESALPKIARLRGRKILVLGNHDRQPRKMKELGFESVAQNLAVEVDGVRLWLRHRPDPEWRRRSTGADYHFCGHVHDLWLRREDVVNVGVDVRGFVPVTVAELLS